MRITIAVAASLALTTVAHSQPEPTHAGHTLSEWVELMEQNPGSHRAVRALGEMGEVALPHIIRAMRTHPDGAIRFLSQLAAADIGEAAVPELDKIMQDGDPTARMQAVLALEKTLGERAIPRLRGLLDDPHPQPRIRAHGALIRLGEPPEEHVAALVELLLDDAASVQWVTAETLGWCGEKAAGAEDALYEATQRYTGGVADRAWQALEEMGTEEAMAYVYERWAESIDDPDAPRADKLKALVAMGKAGAAAEQALPKLQAIVEDHGQDVLIRGYAGWAAAGIAPYTGEPRTFHVAQQHPAASDQNAGTEDAPWVTIQRAAEAARPGDTVLIHGGEYREEVRPFCEGAGPDRLVTYAAAPGETPVILGSDPWEPEWRQEGRHVWSAPYERHPWDRPEEWPNPKEGPMHRAEQVFVDGRLLEHVATLEELHAEADRMYTNDGEGRLWIHIAYDAAPGELNVERSMRQQCFSPAVRGLGYIRVVGLTMRRGAAPESNGSNWHVIAHRGLLSVRAGHHWVIEDNTIEWGNAQGLDVGGEGFGEVNTEEPRVSNEMGYHQVRRNVVNSHGVAGIVGWASGTNKLLLEDNVTNYNCRKGNFWQYEAAGIKLHNAKDCIIRRHRAHGNHAFGIWLDYQCERNRITQCILTENMASGVFHEVSAGPILIDSNVIIGTRNARPGEWGDGVYSHDGNHAIVANNFIWGCEGFGVRFRNLFSRVADGKPTTTSHNRVFNNIIADCDAGPISLNPEVTNAEDNHADHNIIWAHGHPITMQLEDSGSGVKWQETEVGQALGKTGGGDLAVPYAVWQVTLGHDTESLAVPPSLLFGGKTPEQIRGTLVSLWPEDGPPLDGGYGEVEPPSAMGSVWSLVPDLAGKVPTHAMRLGPDFGLQLWGEGEEALELRWQGSDASVLPLSDPVLANAPLRPATDVLDIAAGDSLTLEADAGLRVVIAGLPTEVTGDKITTSVPPDTPPGDYGIVTTMGEHWQWSPVRVGEPFDIKGTASAPNAVRVTVASHLRSDVGADVTVAASGLSKTVSGTLAAQSDSTITVPLDLSGAVPVDVTVAAAGAELSTSALLSFARATRSWDDATTYLLNDFPGGAFPEGAEAFALFQGGLSANWQASYDDAALHLRAFVQDSDHLQIKGIEELWQQDSVQLLLRADAGADPLELDLALPSTGGDAVAFRRQSPNEEKHPLGAAADLAFSVTRTDPSTTYDASIPWSMIGLDAPPDRLLLSLLVNNDNGGGRHGLQWFFGIHTHRGDVTRMGALWLE